MTIPASGASGNPFVIEAMGHVVIDGADNLSGTGGWVAIAGNVYRNAAVTWIPKQVFLDEVRLTASLAAPESLATNSFRFVTGQGLYVNAGGGNPGAQTILAGRRSYGFRAIGRSWIDIRGFTVLHPEDRGIFLTGSSFFTIARDTVSLSGTFGFSFVSSSNLTVEDCLTHHNNDHGFQHSALATSILRRNESHDNARPTVRAANGYYFVNSTGNRIEANRSHHNQDSGFHMQTNSHNNLFLSNQSWLNGDHGYDHLTSTGITHIGDVSAWNHKDGFSFEGNAPSARVFNCIGINNGLTTDEYNLWVDANSLVGFQSDYNVWWNSGPQYPIRVGIPRYATIAEFTAATGRDSHSTQIDPLFMSATTGDFRLLAGSPAIDNATSAVPNWSPLDGAGVGRHDDLSAPNQGAGPTLFADRGAFEFVRPGGPPGDAAPVVTAPTVLSVVESNTLEFTVTAADPDGNPVSGLVADLSRFPSGTASFTSEAGNTSGTFRWTPTFEDSRPTEYLVTFTASNALSATAPTRIRVLPGNRVPVVTAPSNLVVEVGVPLTFDVNANDPDGAAVDTLAADFSVLPSGHNATFFPNGIQEIGTFSWTPATADARGVPYLVVFRASNELTGRDTTAITVFNPTINLSSNPSFEANLTGWNGSQGATLARVAGGHEGSFTAQLTGPATNAMFGLNDSPDWVRPATAKQPYRYSAWVRSTTATGSARLRIREFTLPGGATAGTVLSPLVPLSPTWQKLTVDYTAVGNGSLDFQVLDIPVVPSEVFEADDIVIRKIIDQRPVMVAPAARSATEGVALTFEVSAADPDGEGINSLIAQDLPAGATFTSEPGDTIGLFTWTPAFTSAPGPYTVRFIASNAMSDTAITVIQVADVDRAPDVTAMESASVAEGTNLSFVVRAVDPDGDPIAVLSASGLPEGASFNTVPGDSAGTFSWTPGFEDGDLQFTVRFVAENALADTATTTITVTQTDRIPEVTAPSDAMAVEGTEVSFTVLAGDPDGEAITSFVGQNMPAGATFTINAFRSIGTFRWTPALDAAPGPYTVTFVASNTSSGSDITTIMVANADRAPVITSPPTATVAEGAPLSFVVHASDPDGDPISLSSPNLPPGATFTPDPGDTSGVFNWTPGFDAAPGPYNVSFRASNALADTATTSIDVTPVDRAPVVVSPESATAVVGASLSFVVHAADLDGQAIATLVAQNLPSGATFTSDPGDTTGTFNWTLAAGTPPGPYAVRFVASNDLSGSDTTTISVTNANRAPIVEAPTTATVAEGVLLSFVVHAADPDGEPITSLTAQNLPSGAVFSPNAGDTSGTFTWTPGFAAAPGPYDVRFIASNALTGADTTSITVTNTDHAPVVNAPATASVIEGQQVVVEVTASDPDGDPIASLIAMDVPAGATFVPNSTRSAGTLTWNTTTADGRAAPYAVKFTAQNALSGADTTAITVSEGLVNLISNPSFETNLSGWSSSGSTTLTRVAGGHDGSWSCRLSSSSSSSFGINDSPNIVPSVTAGRRYRYSAWVKMGTGAGQARLRIREYASNGTNHATLYSGFVTLTAAWQYLTLDHVGILSGNYLDFQVLDSPAAAGAAFLVDEIVAYVVSADTASPIVTAPATANVNENQQLVVNVTASDPDGDPITSLVANLSGLPPGHGAQFVVNSAKTAGTLTWTPDFDDAPGPYSVTFTASNTQTASSSTSISVGNVDRAPQVVAPANAALVPSTPISFQVTAFDPDGQPLDSLVADLSGLPAGNNATFIENATHTSGAFDWTPQPGDPPGPYTILFRARNALLGTASTVISSDRAPVVISPSTATVTEGVPMSFVVHAADPDGQPITSLVALDLPEGAAFAAGPGDLSGTFSWTPGFTAAGSYSVRFVASNAQSGADTTAITVSDGVANLASNPSFETNLNGWSTSGTATLARVAGGRSGEWSCRVASTSTGTSSFGLNDSPNIVSSVTAGQRYRYSAWVKVGTGASQARLRIREYTTGGTNTSIVYSRFVTLTASWQQITLEHMVQVTGTYLDFQVLDSPAAVGAAFLVDDVVVQNVPSSTLAAEPAEGSLEQSLAPVGTFRAWLAPNPVRNASVLHLVTTRPGHARARMFDVRGREVATLFDEAMLPAGRHAFALGTRGTQRGQLPAGVYFYRVDATEGAQTGRMVVIE